MRSKLTEMMSNIPTEKGDNVDAQILRVGIISELDAISLYEQLAAISQDENLKKILLDIAKEEKVHVGEFQALLMKLDPKYKSDLEDGAKEVDDKSEANGSTEETEDSNDMNEARERIYGKTSSKKLNEMQNLFKKLVK